MKVNMSHLDVMRSRVMFGVVISWISRPWFPKHIKVFLENYILYPMKTHIHCLGAFLFNDLVGYPNSGVVVHLYRGGWLGMMHFYQFCSNQDGGLAIQEQCTIFFLWCRCHDVAWYFAHNKMNPLSMGVYSLNVSASGLGSLRKNTPLALILALVTDIYEEDHTTGMIPHGCIGIWCKLVEELLYFIHGFRGSSGLFWCNVVKVN